MDKKVCFVAMRLLIGQLPCLLVHSLICQLLVMNMSIAVSLRFFLNVFEELFLEIYARLIGQTQQHPQHISHFVAKVGLLSGLKTLVAIRACHHPGQFSYLLGKYCEIGLFGEIAHAVLLDPLVDQLLCAD